MEKIEALLNTFEAKIRADTTPGSQHASYTTWEAFTKARAELICAIRQDQTAGLTLEVQTLADRQISDLVDEYGKTSAIRGNLHFPEVQLAKAALLLAISKQSETVHIYTSKEEPPAVDLGKAKPCVDTAFSDLVTALMLATRQDQRHGGTANTRNDLDEAKSRVIERFNTLWIRPDLQGSDKAFDNLLDTALAEAQAAARAYDCRSETDPLRIRIERRAASSRDAVRARYAGLDGQDLEPLIEAVVKAAEAVGGSAFRIMVSDFDKQRLVEKLAQVRSRLRAAAAKQAPAPVEPLVPRRDPIPEVYQVRGSEITVADLLCALATDPERARKLAHRLNQGIAFGALQLKIQRLSKAAAPFKEVHDRLPQISGTLPGGQLAVTLLTELMHAVYDLEGAKS